MQVLGDLGRIDTPHSRLLSRRATKLNCVVGSLRMLNLVKLAPVAIRGNLFKKTALCWHPDTLKKPTVKELVRAKIADETVSYHFSNPRP